MRRLLFVLATVGACTESPGSTGPQGVSGEDSLATTRPEPPGTHCANGGVAIETGVDTSGDGVLDPDEVTATTYVCASAPSMLTRTVSEPVGAHCSLGGVAIQSGLDTNGNGQLDDVEVSDTSYLCFGPSGGLHPTTIEGSVVVHNTLDVLALADVSTITGDVTIDANGVTSIGLGQLVSIGGDLVVESTTLTSLDLHALRSVAGSIRFTTPMLPAVELGALETIGADIAIAADNLATFDLGALVSTAGSISVSTSGSASISVDLGALTTVAGGVTLPWVASLACPQLVSAGQLFLGAETSLDLSRLQTVIDLNLSVSGTGLVVLPQLAHVGSLAVTTSNGSSVRLPLLQTIPTFHGGGALELPAVTSIGWWDGASTAGLSMPSLMSVETLRISGRDVVLPTITTLQGLDISSSSPGMMVSLPALTTIRTDLSIRNTADDFTVSLPALATIRYALHVEQNSKLTSISLPSLVSVGDPSLATSKIDFVSNGMLSSISVPLLSSLDGSFNAQRNAQMPTCRLQQLAAAAHPTGTTTISLNSTACP